MSFKVGRLILEGPPMWTCDNRPKYYRDKLHYPSDLTDAFDASGQTWRAKAKS